MDLLEDETDADTRFRELAVHVLERSVTDPGLDRVKLFDILFLSDALARRELGHPLTHAEYVKNPTGPEPVAVELGEMGSALLAMHVNDTDLLVALRPAVLNVFTLDELEIVERAVTELAPCSPALTALYAHDWMSGYRSTPVGSLVPHDAAL